MFLDKFLDNKKILYLNDRHEEEDTGKEDRKKLYDQRILSLLEKDDAVIFAEQIDPFLRNYYHNLGLASIKKENIFYVPNYLNYPSLTKAVLDNQSLIKRIKQRNFDILIPYIESHDAQILARKINCRILRDSSFVDWINNKTNFRQIIQGLNLPIIPGFTASNLKKAKEYFRLLKIKGFEKIVLKKERSVAGFGISIIKTEEELENRLENEFSNQESFLLEGFIKRIKLSPNVQYWVGPEKIDSVLISDQLLDKDRISYSGNIFPSQLRQMPNVLKKIENFSLKFCQYLQKQKCYGLFGIDWIVTGNGDIYPTEANVRLNSSTFAPFIINQLFNSPDKVFWKIFTINQFPVSFKNLFKNLSESFIVKRNQTGIFPVDASILESMGEGQFIAVGETLKEVNRYTKKLKDQG